MLLPARKLFQYFGRLKVKKALAMSIIGLLVIFSMLGCSPRQEEKSLAVFAGSASKPPLDEAAQAFTKSTGINVFCTYGGSGTVLSQMKLSKTGDIYIPGSPDYVSIAERDKAIDVKSTKIVGYLIPVIAVQHGNPKNIQSLADLTKPGIKVGIGNPASVCLGLYSVEIFEHNKILQDVGKNIVTQAASCDATATLVSLKSVDAVIGWHVFHDWDQDRIDVVYLKPEQLPRIAYIPAAISSFTRNVSDSQKFADFLVSKQGQDIFSKWGYIASEQEARKFSPNAKIGGEYVLPEIYKTMVK
jgi:molybdate transport system substrate-binding protein